MNDKVGITACYPEHFAATLVCDLQEELLADYTYKSTTMVNKIF